MSDLNTWMTTTDAARRLGVNPQSLNGRLKSLAAEVGSTTLFGVNGYRVEVRRGEDMPKWRIISEPETLEDCKPLAKVRTISKEEALAELMHPEPDAQVTPDDVPSDPALDKLQVQREFLRQRMREPWPAVQQEIKERIEPKKHEPEPLVRCIPVVCGGINAEIIRATSGLLVKFSLSGTGNWLVPSLALKDLSALSSWIEAHEKQIKELLDL